MPAWRHPFVVLFVKEQKNLIFMKDIDCGREMPFHAFPQRSAHGIIVFMNKQYKQDFFCAGKLAKEVRAYGKSLILKGASYNEVISQINRNIHELGAKPAFPPQIALNEVAAHFLPSPDEDIVFTDQVIKLDIGVSYNGAIGDCAVTVDLSGRYQSLIDAAEAALANAEKILAVGLP